MAPSRTRRSLPLALFTLASLIPSLSAFECNNVLAQGVSFDLHKLGGPRVVHWTEKDVDSSVQMQYNYNFTLDICNTLKWSKEDSKTTQCHQGSRVCGIREKIELSTGNVTAIEPIDIAGTYPSYSGRQLDARVELLRNSKSNADVDRQGVRVELHGGRFPADGPKGVTQQAIIEFVCDPKREGNEEGEAGDGEQQPAKRDENGEGQCEGDASLRFCKYRIEEQPKGKQVQTLRLDWRTKYACEGVSGDDGGHWGFFTWFIIILFLATAAYLIFGSWLNYNRYGARGWDLLPHGDTIRDLPYILKDFGRKVVDTVQGPGSRGGYSAV